jgi:hypothetical protein
MQRISSRWTFFYKRIFPAIWFGFLCLFLIVQVVAGLRSGRFVAVPFLVVPAAMMAFGFFIMKKLIFDLVDEVRDDGDALVIKNRGDEVRVALTDIKNVNYSPFINPPRATLSLRKPTVFGEQITFCAPVRFIPFSANPVIGQLIDRVDRARDRRL